MANPSQAPALLTTEYPSVYPKCILKIPTTNNHTETWLSVGVELTYYCGGFFCLVGVRPGQRIKRVSPVVNDSGKEEEAERKQGTAVIVWS